VHVKNGGGKEWMIRQLLCGEFEKCEAERHINFIKILLQNIRLEHTI
jgi:hypothetical protein